VKTTRREPVTIYVGGVFASRDGTVVRTLLGSCISACLWDPQCGVGGMNHFMLPAPSNGGAPEDLSRFGVHAMELLIGEIQKLGGERRRVQGKLFGGGHVLQVPVSVGCVPAQNILFIQRFMAAEGIPVAAEDLGGSQARQVVFHTDTGRAFVKRLTGAGLFQAAAEKEHQRMAERAVVNAGEITLFDE
jgi:chemotaxis receptor (MCP) glutamine deamidase CheD